MKIKNPFVIGDTHIGHRNILDFCRGDFVCVEEHDKHIIDSWNSVVSNEDTVIHLGDVIFRRENFEKIGLLNGRKILVMGNHDGYGAGARQYLEYFDDICGVLVLGGCVLTHIPVHSYCLGTRYKFNVHGHVHQDIYISDRHINVNVDVIGYKPVRLDGLVQSRLIGLQQDE